MEWNDETIARLRSLWGEGHSTAEIGRRIGISKNAVVGKAHRLGLASRPSPIRREPGGLPRVAPPRRVIGPTLPPLSAPPVLPAAPERHAPEPRLVPEPRPTPALISATAGVPAGGRVQACCWPLGEPGTKSFRFCDAGSVPGKPYCLEHAQIAYVRVRDRREEAA
jgi:GcrA cell cycle regulator